jgi:hypothetical protein
MKDNENKNEIVPIEEQKEYSIEPSQTVDFATKASKQLKDIVDKTKSTVILGNNTYMKFEGWQTVAKFFGSTVSVESTKPVIMKDKDGAEQIFGYEATAVVLNDKGKMLSRAENGCFRDEYNWKDKPSFQLRSMAQTRASAKALRQVYAWVVVLAGYSPTPAEEVDNLTHEKPVNNFQSQTSSKKSFATPIVKDANKETEMVCQGKDCGDELSEKVFNFSMQRFNKPLCFTCQEKIKAELAKIPKEYHNTPKPIKRTDSDNDADEEHI